MVIKDFISLEGSSISRQNLSVSLETLNLATIQYLHLPGFYPKTGFLNHHPLSLVLAFASLTQIL